MLVSKCVEAEIPALLTAVDQDDHNFRNFGFFHSVYPRQEPAWKPECSTRPGEDAEPRVLHVQTSRERRGLLAGFNRDG